MKYLLLPLFALVASFSAAQSGLWVDLPTSARSQTTIYGRVDAAVRSFGTAAADLTEQNVAHLIKLKRFDDRIPFALPMTVRLTKGGKIVSPVKRASGDLVLSFASSGDRAFPAEYRALLQSVFDTAKGTLNAVYGTPASGGTVLVSNFDADIGDRDAVAGGYYLPNNGSGSPEIRFPVYVSPEAAAVNFVHCLLLAYTGPNTYGFDAFQEGLARAAAMRVVRTAGALPSTLDTGIVDLVLDNTYDVGSFYDWYNQRALGASQFIANNLRTVPLPGGGSLGGVYLLRYQMAGSAWQKMLAEYPGFFATFNQGYYANPSIASNVPALVALGQTTLDTLAGASGAKVEGLTFAEWFRRQYILETKDTLGEKLLVQPIPIESGLGGDDFGVFDVAATYFETQPGANEVLLSGTSHPIFWDQSFNRIFPSTQEDTMEIAGAFGSVTPNLPNINGNKIYRCTADIPVGDRIARAYLPAGAIATASSSTPNNVYGCVTGLTLTSSQTGRVRISIGSTVLSQPSIVNGAFGANITQSSFSGYARLKVEVIRKQGSTDTVMLTRWVNKGPGELALDLRVGGDTTYTAGLTKGIQALGLPIDPWASTAGEVLNLDDSQVLAARYDPTRSAFDLYPDSGPFMQGFGEYLRYPTTANVVVSGRVHPGTPVAVALKPGWNMVASPLNEDTAYDHIQVINSVNFPSPMNEALGVDIGSQIFQFVPGANDPASGAPETGSYAAITSFPSGKAVFVRVLAAEGVTLLFTPSNLAGKAGVVPNTNGWLMKAELQKGTTKSALVLGESSTASTGFDKKFDSPVPPKNVTGLRAYVSNSDQLAKDVRLLGSAQTYRVRFDYLTKGQVYTVAFSTEKGAPPSFTLKDTISVVTKSLKTGSTYTFVAKSASHQFDIIVAAGSK